MTKPDLLTGPRETVYDEQMAPLVTQLLEIAKDNSVPLFIHAALDGDAMCTSNIPGGGTVREIRQAGWMLEAARGVLVHAERIRITKYADDGEE